MQQNAARQTQELAAIVENLKNENNRLNAAVASGASDKDVEIGNYKNVCEQLSKELEVSERSERALRKTRNIYEPPQN